MEQVYHYIGLSVFWTVVILSILLSLWFSAAFVYKKVYIDSKIDWYVKTLKVYYRHKYKKQPVLADVYKIKYILNNKKINTLPKFMKDIWFKLANARLTELRNEILSHGEVPSF